MDCTSIKFSTKTFTEANVKSQRESLVFRKVEIVLSFKRNTEKSDLPKLPYSVAYSSLRVRNA